MAAPPDWRAEANERFPEMRQQFDEYECDTPYLLWFQLRDAFQKAYDANPRNESLIRRVYLYYEWCSQAARGKIAEDGLLTCVAVCFWEHIPQHPAAREDMARWFTLEEILESRGIFGYVIGENDFANLVTYFRSHRNSFVPWAKTKAKRR